MRTTVDLEVHLLKQLRAEARRRGLPFKQVLAGAIRRGLAEAPAAKRAAYRVPTAAMGEPRGSFSIDRALAAAAAFEDEEVVAKLARRK